MYCEQCHKPIKENTEGNKRYCQGHSIFELTNEKDHDKIKKLQKEVEKCKHTSVAFLTRTVKLIPEGFEAFNEQEDIDLEDYQTTYEEHKTVCDDCGEELEGGI